MHERIEKMRSVCAVGNYSAFTQGLLLQLAARVKPQDVVCSPRRTSCRPFPLAIGHAPGGTGFVMRGAVQPWARQ